MLLNDRELTQLQQTGVLTLTCIGSTPPSVAELLDACNTLGIDPKTLRVVPERDHSVTLVVC